MSACRQTDFPDGYDADDRIIHFKRNGGYESTWDLDKIGNADSVTVNSSTKNPTHRCPKGERLAKVSAVEALCGWNGNMCTS